ncbi:mitochondrial protein [Pseudozyma hubeiensis SY62]|uniref:Mitochondrial protein n=1 Tax=Pseudozyma hubeiensis (strain SY62) TaxID=1305764 RepID=R9PAW5_PSEHS|nr:mitochondrial protein [Pseudozyma hubeiensis SY62]GAC98357.1 mitochondrial protein [Pseudozyma hubeiensis SY62]
MSSAKTQFFDLPDSGGCRMAYRTLNSASSRTPLFLINGLSAVMTDWSPLFESLAATRPVVISDHRAIGESTVTEEWDQELTLESMGLDVLHLASHLGYTTIDLLGFSMGGHITQALLSSPSATVVDGLVSLAGVKIRKAVLSATMTKLPRGDANLNELNAEAEKIPDKKQRNEFITEQMMRLQYHPSALDSNPTLQRKFQSRLREVRQTSRPAWIIGLQFMAIQQADLRKQLHRIPCTVPVLVIHGKRDRMVLWNESEHILTGIQHASRLTTPDEEFAHFWYDYFDIDFWSTSIVNFLDDQTKSKL